MASQENLLPFDGEVYYYANVFNAHDCNRYLQTLTDAVAWKQEPIKIFGRQVMQPRLTAWYGDTGKTYAYSGVAMLPSAWTEELIHIKAAAEQLAGVDFTGALLNFYRDGRDGMGWHRDNEKMLGTAPVIASVSFGETRNFQFRNYSDKSTVRTVDLVAGSILVMRGATQQKWEHRIPKTTRVNRPRINITFRVL